MIRPILLCLALSLSAPPLAGAQTQEVPVRVFAGPAGAASDQQALLDAAAQADVVFVGEQHDDKAGHRFQLALLEGLAARGRRVVLAMEMFERDVQPALDDYLAGRTDEPEMRRRTRPWPNYGGDYRPLVEFARAQGWPVVAANAPRPLAARIARGGLAALDALAPAQRLQVAAELRCEAGAYRDKFMAEMRGMSGHGGDAAGAPDLEQMFESQCAKDETMAESVAQNLAPGVTVVHLNGAFHSDQGLGVVERLKRRRPDARVLVVSIVKGDTPGRAADALGDFVVRTP